MPRTRLVPREARHLRSYDEFRGYLRQFAEGVYPFVWVTGRPGVAKSESITDAVRGRRVYYRKGGQITPLKFYLDCYEYRNAPLVLDDAEHLLRNPLGAKLITALGDTSRVKQLSYGTSSRALGETPEAFTTSSSLCIIANVGTAHEAIQSRALSLYFDPTNLEVHRAVAEWFLDQEIHDWFGRHLSRMRPTDARWYVRADQDKRAGRGWRQLALNSYALNRAAAVVQDLEADPAYPTGKDRERRFKELIGEERDGTGKSRSSYYGVRRRLVHQGSLTPEVTPPIPLRHKRAPAPPAEVELESLAAPVSQPPPGVVAVPLDVPLREDFARPVRGDGAASAAPAGPALDDSVAWEARQRPEDEDEGGE